MRKTRLVILPTKCLHQMGFLLLFLSCPVIGDWGRIRPESATSHKAIQIEKEGTCGLQRDTPGGLLDFLNANGSKQCRNSELHDLIKPIDKPTSEEITLARLSETRRVSQRNGERRVLNERREATRRNDRLTRSRSVEPRRLSLSRSRSLSEIRHRRETANENTRRTNQRRLSLARQQEERRSDQRREIRRREETERTGRVAQERRLSLSRMERRDDRRVERSENVRREDSERRLTSDVRAAQNTRRVDVRRDIREAEKAIRLDRRTDSRREIESRRLSLPTKLMEVRSERRATREISRNERRETATDIRGSRLNIGPKSNMDENWSLNDKNGEFLDGVTSWMGLKNYDGAKIGEWTTNCVIGAVAYFITSRQVKTV